MILLLNFAGPGLLVGLAAENKVQQQALMIVGYDGTAWFPYITPIDTTTELKSTRWTKIKAIHNPLTLTRQPGTGDFFIKADNSQLYRYQIKNKTLVRLFSPDLETESANNYTQLRAHNNGLVMVKLLEGKSRDTQLVSLDVSLDTTNIPIQTAATIKSLVNQVSAQFHPLIHQQHLYYAHVSCRLACDPLIMEVWSQDLISGKTQQLTMLNATSYLHSVDAADQWGFISSNQQGYYHLARLDLNTHTVIWLTNGQVTDSFPSISRDNNLYFIRRTQAGTELMMIEKAQLADVSSGLSVNALKKIALPKDVKKIRYLELTDL